MNRSSILSLFAGAVLLLASCQNQTDFEWGSRETGFVSLGSVGIDASTNAVNLQQQTKATKANHYDTLDYKVTIRNKTTGAIIYTAPSMKGMPETVELGLDRYTVTLESTNRKEAAFSNAMFAGSADFTLQTKQTVQVPVTCKLDCVLAQVVFSDNIKNGNFTSYKVTLWGNGTEKLEYNSLTAETGYFSVPETLYYKIELVNSQGARYTKTDEITGLKRADLVKLIFDIPSDRPSDETEALVMDVVVNREINEVSKEFTMSATLESTGTPFVTGRLIDISQPIPVKYGEVTPVKFDLVTAGGMDKVLFIFQSESYTQIPGASQIMDLSETKNQNLLGISFEEGGTPGAASSLMDLTGFTNKLPGDPSQSVPFTIVIGLLDKNGQYATKQVVFNVYGVSISTKEALYGNEIDWMGVRGARNMVNVQLTGQWNVDAIPEELTFKYREAGAPEWISIDPALVNKNEATKTVSASVSVPAEGKSYEYKLVSANEDANTQNFTVPNYPTIPNMGFDDWHIGNNSTYYPYLSSASAADKFWDTGNYGLTSASSLASFASNSVYDTGRNGVGKSAKLTSVVAKKMGIGHFAAGNIFTGYFNFTSLDDASKQPWVMSRQGKPFVGRPKGLKGYYKYTSVAITDKEISHEANLGAVGDPDACDIVLRLEYWGDKDCSMQTPEGASVDGELIAFGRFSSSVSTTATTSDFVPFTIELDYKSDKMPDHIVIVATASRYGAFMTGGNGSVLWVDDFEFIWY